MRKLKFFLACLFIVSVSLVSAQTKVASGKVVSAKDGKAIVGAKVIVKGTSNGMITDNEGKYKLKVKKSVKTLVVSLIGMKKQEVLALPNQIVKLENDISTLNTVVVTAFGKTTKAQFTGSASVISADDIVKNQSSNITNNLSGKIAGVQGLSGNGQPGTGSKIRIRGIGSMNASNSPLYIVDGVPYDTDISSINNADIESVTVLKDAASNALYGARGANGVIIITTKRGKGKEGVINVDMKWGSNSRAVPSYRVMTDPGMYYETYYRAMYNSKIKNGSIAAHDYANKYLLDASNDGLGYLVYTVPKGERLIGTNFKLNPNAKLGYTEGEYTYRPDDWYKEIFNKTNLREEYNVNISGSTDNLTYYASAGKLKDTGIIPNSDFQRFTTRTNVDYDVKKWLKVGTNLSFVQSKTKYPDSQTSTSSSGNLFFISSAIAPIYPLYVRNKKGDILVDERGDQVYDYGDGKIFSAKRPFMTLANPMGALLLDQRHYTTEYFVGKWYAEIMFLEGLKGTVSYGITSANEKGHSLRNKFYGQFAGNGGSAYVSQSRFFSENQQYLLSYLKKFNGHSIDLLAGFESYSFKNSDLSGYKTKLYQPNVAELNNAILEPSTSSSSYGYATQGFLARGLYNYDSKYFLSLSFRRDGSSVFAPENRWGNFWSFGTAWNITEEDFMSDFESINVLKLKASYGAQGNDKLLNRSGTINWYPYTDQFSISENNGNFAASRFFKGNKNITWETSHNFNIGVDFSVFDERLEGTLEYFDKRTTDMLYYKPVSPSLGYDWLPVNVGSVQNSGVELELNAHVIKTNSFNWDIYANATTINNKILALSKELDGEWIDGSYIYKEGKSLYNLYIRKYAGVDKKDGSSLWYMTKKDADGKIVKDKDGNDVIEKTADYSKATRYEIGNILPKVYGGFGTSIDYRGFDFSMAFAYQLGGKIYDYGYSNAMHGGDDKGRNWHVDILDAWTPENTDTDVPRVNILDTYTNGQSDRFLISSDYLSLQNVTLGYSLSKRLLDKVHISKLRFYVVADNVALFSKRQGLDPRQGYSSSSGAVYAPIRTISGGLSISF